MANQGIPVRKSTRRSLFVWDSNSGFSQVSVINPDRYRVVIECSDERVLDPAAEPTRPSGVNIRVTYGISTPLMVKELVSRPTTTRFLGYVNIKK